MLEIALLFVLSKQINAMAKRRDIVGWPFVILLIALWIIGELTGAVAGVIVLGDNGADGFNLAIIPFAIPGAAIGAGLTFAIVAVIPKRTHEYDGELDRSRRRAMDEDDDFDRPIRPRDERGVDDPRFRDRPG